MSINSKYDCKRDSISIVLVGPFAPKAFHPTWLSHHNLIDKGLAESATVILLTPEVARFDAGWLSVEVLPDRFTAMTNDASTFVALRDLALSLRLIIGEIPITQMGLNAEVHYAFQKEKDYIEFGYHLVPTAPWENVLDNMEVYGVEVRGKRHGAKSKTRQIRIAPSAQFKMSVAFATNEHFEANDLDFLELIRDDSVWLKSIESAHDVAKLTINNFLKEQS